MININLLEYKRLEGGENALKDEFLRQVSSNKENGAVLLNDARTTFPTLFLLIPELKNTGLLDKLNARNTAALSLCAKIHNDVPLTVKLNMGDGSALSMQSLAWMVSTGAVADGLSDDYDEVLDKAAILLVVKYGEKSVLSTVTNMVFNRAAAGRFNHNLIWALFKSGGKDALGHIATYLRSPKQEDVELARELLCFVPRQSLPVFAGTGDEYRQYMGWINSNLPYLVHTVESNQYSSSPKAFELDAEAKYLGIPAEKKSVASPSQLQYLEKLEGLDDEQRTLLAEASAALRAKSVKAWSKWLDSPADSQLVIARTMTEGRL